MTAFSYCTLTQFRAAVRTAIAETCLLQAKWEDAPEPFIANDVRAIALLDITDDAAMDIVPVDLAPPGANIQRIHVQRTEYQITLSVYALEQDPSAWEFLMRARVNMETLERIAALTALGIVFTDIGPGNKNAQEIVDLRPISRATAVMRWKANIAPEFLPFDAEEPGARETIGTIETVDVDGPTGYGGGHSPGHR